MPAQVALRNGVADDTQAINKVYNTAIVEANPDTCIRLYKLLLAFAETRKNDSACNGFSLKLGEYYLKNGDYVQAVAYTKHAFQFNSSLSYLDQANAYVHLGIIYFDAGNYVRASVEMYNALDMLNKDPRADLNLYPVVYRFLGMINMKLHQNDYAIRNLNQSEDSARNNHLWNLIALTQLSKGDYYIDINKTDSARICLNEAIVIADTLGRRDIRADANEDLGRTYLEDGDYTQAVHYLHLAIRCDDSIDLSAAVDAAYFLGEALYHLGKYKEAEAVLIPALRQAAASKLTNNVTIGYSTLALVFKATGQLAKAISYMDTLSILKDSLVSAEKANAINLMEIKYQSAKKDKELAKSQLLIARQNSKIARKNMWMSIVGGGVLLLLLVCISAYLNSLNKQRTLEKENKIGVLKAAIQGEDNERARLARELHDGIGGMLSAAMMRISSMHNNNAANVSTAPEYTEAMTILREIGDEIRKTAHNLMPEVLLKQSLPDAIRAYCNSIPASGLHISFQSFGSFDDLPRDYKLNIYRIIQELIKNVIQHAHARYALVQLLRNEEALIVSVEDNGLGFDEKVKSTGQGLHNTETRVRSIDGHFTLESAPGKGTSVFIEFPFHKTTKRFEHENKNSNRR